MHVCVNSLGMLSTEKEITDALNDKQPGHDQISIVKGIQNVNFKVGSANIPLIVTNHTYDVIGSYVPTKEMGGGMVSNMSCLRSFIFQRKKKRIRRKLLVTLLKLRRQKA